MGGRAAEQAHSTSCAVYEAPWLTQRIVVICACGSRHSAAVGRRLAHRSCGIAGTRRAVVLRGCASVKDWTCTWFFFSASG